MLKIADIVFSGLAAPESFPLGGEQKITVKEMPGGGAVAQIRGDFSHREAAWTGTFLGGDANQKARRMDEIRAKGESVTITFGGHTLFCFVNKFIYHWRNERHIEFSISLIRDFEKEKVVARPKTDPVAKVAAEVLQASPPKKQQTVYTVVAGDSLWRIAQQFSTTIDRIYNDNRQVIGRDPNLIQPGQKLVIT